MKKFIFIFLIMVISYSNLEAQLIRAYGITMGAASSTQSWEWNGTKNDFTRFHWGGDLGLFVEWLNDSHFSLITEASYVQKGLKLEVTYPPYHYYSLPLDTTITYAHKIDYLSFAAMLKYRTSIGVFSPYLVLGPRFDIQVYSKPGGFSDDVINNLSKSDYGLNIGSGIECSTFSAFIVGAEFRYNLSLHNVLDNNGSTVKNSSMEFLLFISF
jgi:hypothetical protein